MGKDNKLRDKFFHRPYRSDITLDEVIIFLAQFGYSLRKNSGSHPFFVCEGKPPIIIASKSGKYILAAYIKNICTTITAIEEEK